MLVRELRIVHTGLTLSRSGLDVRILGRQIVSSRSMDMILITRPELPQQL